MSYLDQSVIASNNAMRERVAQCATGEGQPDADQWTLDNRREWAAAPGWDEAWRYATDTHPEPDPPDPTVPYYDPGADESVITDAMILSQVQAMMAGS